MQIRLPAVPLPPPADDFSMPTARASGHDDLARFRGVPGALYTRCYISTTGLASGLRDEHAPLSGTDAIVARDFRIVASEQHGRSASAARSLLRRFYFPECAPCKVNIADTQSMYRLAWSMETSSATPVFTGSRVMALPRKTCTRWNFIWRLLMNMKQWLSHESVLLPGSTSINAWAGF